MNNTTIDKIKYGYFLEENLYRFDGLLALPRGAAIREIELRNIKDLQPKSIDTTPFHDREFTNEETLEIIKEVIEYCTLWDDATGNRIFDGLEKSLKKNKKVLSVLSLMRETDHYTFTASLNTALVIAHLMIVDNKVDKELINIVFYTLIHDIGKIKVAKITQKIGELSELEFKKIQEHPLYSLDLLLKYGLNSSDISFVSQTHERYDGSGYPLNLREFEIQPMAQVVAVAEMYNALASFRPHRAPFHPLDISAMIQDEAKRAFAEEFVTLFINRFNPYQEGTFVILEDGRRGVVTKVNKQVPLFPTIAVFKEGTQQISIKYNLYRHKELRILKVFKNKKGDL